MIDAELAHRLGFSPQEGESDEELSRRVELFLQLSSIRPITLRDYCDLASFYAGRDARATGREVPGKRYIELRIDLPYYRRLFGWQRRRVERRVQKKIDEVREVNLVVTVSVYV